MIALIVLLFFAVGILVGMKVAQWRARRKQPEADIALAKAWQQGVDAAQAKATARGDAPGPVHEAILPRISEQAQGIPLPSARRIDPGEDSAPESGTANAPTDSPIPEALPNPMLHGLFPKLAAPPAAQTYREESAPMGMRGSVPEPTHGEGFASAQAGVSPYGPVPPQGFGDRQALVPTPVDPQVRALRNINITLYVAALLLVASASLFISFALNPSAKIVGLGIVTAGFYVVGLVVRARSQRLRPAAAAFTATGLALLPMTGFAYYMLIPSSPGMVWLVTSMLGTVAFMYAAGKLQSRVIAAVGTTFLVSVSVAGGAVLNRGLVFYFLFSMVLASAITVVGMRRPKWLSNIYLQSFLAAHRFLVPAILLASVASFAIMHASDYAWIFAAAALYYAISLPLVVKPERYWYFLASRTAAMTSVVAFLVQAEAPANLGVHIIAALLVAQAVWVSFNAKWYLAAFDVRSWIHLLEVWVLLGIAATCALLRFPADGLPGGISVDGNPGWDTVWALPLVLVGTVLVAHKLGRSLAWAPLGVGLLALTEPFALASGRLLILFGFVLAITWALARREVAAGNPRRVQGVRLLLAARVVSPIFGATLLGWAATGWSWEPKESLIRKYLSGGASMITEADVAGIVGFTLTVLLQVLWSIRILYRQRIASGTRGNGPEVSKEPVRRPSTGELPVGEAAVFAGGLLVAALATAVLGFVFRLPRAVTLGGPEASAEFWVGTDWSRPMIWLLFAVGLCGASAILGFKPVGATQPNPVVPAQLTPSASAARGPGQGARQLIHVGGAISVLAALLLGVAMDPAWLVEVFAVLALAYVLSRLLAFDASVPGIVYALAAQLLFSGTVWHLAERFTMDGHGQFGLLAVTIAVPQTARLLARDRIASIGAQDIQSFLNLATIAVLGLIPLVYLGSGVEFVGAGYYDQAALLVQFLGLLLVSWLLARTYVSSPVLFNGAGILAGASVLAIILTPTLNFRLRHGGWLPSPLWNEAFAAGVLAVLVGALLYAEARNIRGSGYLLLRAALVLLYLGSEFALAQNLGPEWKIIAGVLGSVGAIVFSSTLGIPLMVGASVLFLLYCVSHGLEWFRDAAGLLGGQPQDLILLCCTVAVMLLIAAIFGGRFSGDLVPMDALTNRTRGWSPAHARVLFTSALGLVGLAGIAGLLDETKPLVYLGAVLLVFAVCLAALLEVRSAQRESAFEIGGLVAAGVLLRCLWVANDGLGFFAVAYYWFVVIAILAAYEFYRKRESRAVPIMSTASGVLSLSGVATILTSTLGEQLVVLLSFSALLVFGLVSNRRLFTVWAAIGIGAAVLWFLRGYTFLLLLLLAAGLIALALWRLGKMNKTAAHPHRDPAGGQPPVPPNPQTPSNLQTPVNRVSEIDPSDESEARESS